MRLELISACYRDSNPPCASPRIKPNGEHLTWHLALLPTAAASAQVPGFPIPVAPWRYPFGLLAVGFRVPTFLIPCRVPSSLIRWMYNTRYVY